MAGRRKETPELNGPSQSLKLELVIEGDLMTEKKYKVLVTDTSVRPEGTDLLRSIAELDFLETRATQQCWSPLSAT